MRRILLNDIIVLDVQISYKNKRLCKQLTQTKNLAKHGTRRAKLIKRRLAEMEAMENLAMLKQIPRARLHLLVGNRQGQLSVDLDGQYRLIFVPDTNSIHELLGRWDWERINKVKIMEIADTHE